MSVEIVPLPLKIQDGESFLSYDDRLNRVVLKTLNGFGYVLLDDPDANRKYYSSDKPIKDAKFSPNLKYSAIQFNDFDIEILHLENGTRYIQSCKYKSSKGTTILGFYWTQNDNILLVTNVSLELYVMGIDGSCKLVKESKMKITSCVYSFNCNFGVLFLHSGGTSIQPYFFRSNSFDKLPKFNIEGNNIGSNGSGFNIKNLYVTKLHEKFFCVYGDTDYIYLYEMTLETIYKIKPIKILLSGPNTIHFVDNLIIVHSELKISIVYDLKTIQRDRDRGVNNKKEPEFPISAIPMTVSQINNNNLVHLMNNATKTHSPTSTTSTTTSTSSSVVAAAGSTSESTSGESSPSAAAAKQYKQYEQQQIDQQQLQAQQQLNQNLYSKNWKFICPNYIFDPDTGIWYEVTLNFEKISNFLQFDSHKTIPFLQERTLSSAKFALLSLIKTIIEFKTDSLDGIGKIYDDLNKVLFRTTNRQLTESLHKSLNQQSSYTQQQLQQQHQQLQQQLQQQDNNNSNTDGGNSKMVSGNSTSTPTATGSTSNVNNLSYLRYKQQLQQSQLSQQDDDEEDSFDLIGDLNTNDNNYTPTKPTVNKLSQSYSSPSHSSPSTSNLNFGRSSISSSSSNISNSTSTSGNSNSTNNNHMVQNRVSRTNQYILINSHDMYDFVFNPIYEKLLIESQHQQQQAALKEKEKENGSGGKDTTDSEEKKSNNHGLNGTMAELSINEKLIMDSKYLIAVVIQYIKSLSFNQCTGISDKLYNLLISLLIDNNMFSKLHQFLQYYVITDSLSIAYKLLSIGEQYPPVLQLSLDMFKRLNMPNIIIETLLERNQVIQAIRLLRSTKETNPQAYQELLNLTYPIKFLQVSSNQNNDTLFYSVFKFFETNSLIMPSHPQFDKYIKLFVDKFTEKSLSPQLIDLINNTNNIANNATIKKSSSNTPPLRSLNSSNSSPRSSNLNISYNN